MDQPSHTLMVVPFSIFSCPLYDVQTIAVVRSSIWAEPDTTWTTLTDAEGKDTWLTDVMVCVPAQQHGALRDQQADNCPYRGCDTPERYLSTRDAAERLAVHRRDLHTRLCTTCACRLTPTPETGARCLCQHHIVLAASQENVRGRTAVVDIKYVIPRADLAVVRERDQEHRRRRHIITSASSSYNNISVVSYNSVCHTSDV